MSEEEVYIESPVHQLKTIEEAVKDTGSAMLIVVGVEEFADELVGLTREEILARIADLRQLPEVIMGGERIPNAPQTLPVFIFVDQPLADALDNVAVDEKDEPPEE